MRLVSPSFATLVLVLTLAACGGSDDASSGSATDDADRTPAANTSETRKPAELTEADVDAFHRGLEREIEAVRAANAQQSAATTPEERGRAMQAGYAEATAVEGAKAAGMAPERYEEVRKTMVEVLRKLDFQGKIDGPMQLDTMRLSPEDRREAARDPLADLTPASAAAVRSRLDRLAPVWGSYVRLTAVGG